MTLRMDLVTPASTLEGEDEEDTALLRDAREDATAFLRSFEWCQNIEEIYFASGVGGVVAVFLFRIEGPMPDEWLWVIVGDLPSCYLVPDRAETPAEALEVYCELMSDWAEAVRNGASLDDVFPVAAPATRENAEALATRIAFLRRDVIPAFRSREVGAHRFPTGED